MRSFAWFGTPRRQTRRPASSLVGLVGIAGGLVGCLAALSALLAPGTAHAAEYYVATTGSDSNAGTMAAPFATLQKGHDVAAAGDTVWIRGGTYKVVNGKSNMSGFTFSRSGTSDAKRIKYWAYPGELPIFDFSGLKISASTTSAGFYVTGNWMHFKGLEVAHVPMPGTVSNNGIWNVGGSNNTFELLNIHHNAGPGLSIADGTGGHLILNCDSHDNYDPNAAQGAGQNGDGFGCHYQKTGPSTTYRGCRSWWNSDDGYDLISQEVPVIFQNCWAMGNGYINSGTARPASGNGNGFKAGSSKTGIRHVIKNCLAWKNTAAGFYANHSSGGNDWYNNTSYNNGTQFNMLASPSGDTSLTIVLSGTKAHKMRNNIGFPDKNANMDGVDTGHNTWDLNITPAVGDFASVTDTGFMGPRQADGSLPNIDFMKLKAGSQMIDKGTDVGTPAVGAAPDLGCFEYGAVMTSVGSGGAGGGTSGSGGGSATGPDGGAATGGAGMTGTGGSGVSGTGGDIGSGTGGDTSRGTGGISELGTGGNGTTGGASGGAAGAAGPGAGGDQAASGCACAIDGAEQPAGRLSATALVVMGIASGLLLQRRRRAAAQR